MLWVVKDAFRRAGFDDRARVHDGDGIRDFGHHAKVMGDHDRAHIGLGLKVADQFEDLRLNGHVEGGRRFIRD